MRWNLGLAGLAASWGLIAVLVSAVDVDAVSLAFLRLGLAAATLALLALATRRAALLAPAGRLPALVALGVVQGAHWLLFFESVKLGTVALAVLTFYTAPLVIALVAPLVLPERLSLPVLGAFGIGAVGVALVAADGSADASNPGWAVAAGLGSAVTYAALVILAKRLLHGAVPPLTIAFWDCLVGAVAVAPALLLATRVLPSGARELAGVLLLGVVLTGLSTLAYASLLRRVTAQAAGLLTFLEPVSGVLLAWALLSQEPGARTLLGGALVLAAGAVVVLLEPADLGVADLPAGVGSGSS